MARDAVTGVSGFSGRHIAKLLVDAGQEVVNLTGHPDRPTNLGGKAISVPFNFNDPTELARSLEGVSTLYNTYWIRFAHGGMTFEKAVANSKTLIQAAREAGVGRLVHVSIRNPSVESGLPYFKGKAEVEQAIVESGLSYAILRPAVIFGDGGILINNIAWFLRHTPVFAIPGSGEYALQPVYVEDLADLAVSLAQRTENLTIDAVGPEAPSFNELVGSIKRVIGSKTMLIHADPPCALLATTVLGWLLRDVVLTRDEVMGLSDNLLVSKNPPTCHTKLSTWLGENADWLGRRYFSEVGKHFA